MKAFIWRLALLMTLVLAGPMAQAAPAFRVSLDHPSPALWRFLKHEFRHQPGNEDLQSVWAHVAVVRLPRRHTDLIFVQVTQANCGADGCWLEVYESARGGGPPFHLRGDTSLSITPIRLLPTTHHGLPDIVLNTGYVMPGSSPVIPVVVPFDGRHYPDMPIYSPARPAKRWERRGGTLLVPGYPLGDRRLYGLQLAPAVP